MMAMRRRLIHLIAKIGFPVLAGQFLFDWISNDFPVAIGHLPLRAALLFILLLGCTAFRGHRDAKNQTFR